MTIKICVSIPPRTIAEALTMVEKAEYQHADIIEVRLDYLEYTKQLGDIPCCSNTPMIATNRSKPCQGGFQGSESERKKILIDAATNGFEYVDLELSTPKLEDSVTNLRNMNVKPIISFHDFNATPNPSHLNQILKKELGRGAHFCKIVTTAKFIEDNLTILKFVSTACKSARIVCFAMGDLGKPSRLLSPLFGASFTIAALEKKRKTALGQLSILEMKKAYEALELN